jgi:gas vesicle protein
MNNQEGNHHSSHNGGSFLLGVIVGAVIVFLFATKKGKKILKLLSEEGLENISKYVDFDEDDQEESEDDLVPEEPLIQSNGEVKEQNGEAVKSKKKRFFRKSK